MGFVASVLAALTFVAVGALRTIDSAPDNPELPVDFGREILPVLADNCFKCHGPDAGSRRAGLRLDSRAGAVAVLASGGRAVVPGDPDASELVRRITATDVTMRMPPPEAHKEVTPEEVDRIRRWIADGAEWDAHWAFATPRRVDVPYGPRDQHSGSEIDAFIRARLASAGLTPAPAADKEILLRRVTLDLTGLPPSIEEIDAFLTDEAAGAYARVVDRLLASPRFGEHFAVPWLDIARYADSYGYQSDQLSPTWPYRDWLVRALNRNQPYDEFIIHQLAGDLIDDPTPESRLATAFNRLHRMTNEGGSIEQEFRVEYAADRVQTMGTAFMGLTLECARCHDHKFDPITAHDYYGLYAFFNNIDEWGMYNDSSRVPTPTLLLPTESQQVEIDERQRELEHANAHLQDTIAAEERSFQEWLANAPACDATLPHLVGRYSLDELQPDNRFENIADPENPASTAPANTLVPGHSGHALRFTGDDEASFPHVAGAMQPWEEFSIGFWLNIPDGLDDAVIFHRSAGTDVGRYGTELSLRDGRLFFAMIRFWPGNAIAIESTGALPHAAWVHVTATYDGSGTADGLQMYIDGSPAEVTVLRNRLLKPPGAGGHGVTFGQRFRDAGLRDALIDDVLVFNRAIAPIEAATLVDPNILSQSLQARDASTLRSYYFHALNEAVATAKQERAHAVELLLTARASVVEVPVMEELPGLRPAYVLARGAYDAPRTADTRVERSTPAALPPFSQTAPRNRVGLAQWLTSRNHPLTARVAVNRYWQHFFGRGLVATSEDFGIQGTRPTHPELLDHLSIEFIESGWDVKALCRRIALSATYRQASASRPEAADRDPDNALLSRGPSHRLSAEVLRDLALAASGLLDETMGGPPVSPYQPVDLWREANSMSPAYRQSVGTALYRRSLYSVWKRTAPLPNMIVFDASRREACTTRRLETNTPMQALVLLNDPQFVEASRVLAERALRDCDADDDRLTMAFRLLTGRRPIPDEMTILRDLLREQRAIFEGDPDAAARLLSVGEAEINKSLDPTSVAAMTVVVQAILNADATVWQR